MNRLLFPLAAVLVIALASCGQTPISPPPMTPPPSPPAQPPAPTPPASGITATEQRVLDLVNQARASARTCGTNKHPAAAPLVWDAKLAVAARGHAKDMADRNYFSHTSQDGRSFVDRITNAGYKGFAIGENIAAGQQTAEDVMQSWLNSAGHCNNIMNADAKELGVGMAQNSSSQYGVYWVQNFGAR